MISAINHLISLTQSHAVKSHGVRALSLTAYYVKPVRLAKAQHSHMGVRLEEIQNTKSEP